MHWAAVTALIVVAWFTAPATHGQEMRANVRLNTLAMLLDADKPAFGLIVNFGGVGVSIADAVGHSSNNDIDLVMYDMEHNPFDINELRTYMQFLLDPGAIAKSGDVKASKTVIVRIPAYGREIDHNEWMVKQVLDVGAHGVVFSTIETPEQAFSAIRSMRYPQKEGVKDFEPDGRRGHAPNMAARYWGLSIPEYNLKSDLWRLDPDGNLIPWLLIENKAGVANVREIARQLKAKNIGAVLWAGTGDLGIVYGGDQQAVQRAVDTVLAAGKEFQMPVALNGSANAKQRVEQGARIFMGGASVQVRKDVGR
jgi:4-hydroxy-2-oxoheptanedioate aldolase